MKRLIVGIATIALALALVGAALGAPRSQGYQGQAGGVQGEVQQGQAAGGVASGALPFSGQDLTIFVVAGLVLILAGGGFYRLNRRRS